MFNPDNSFDDNFKQAEKAVFFVTDLLALLLVRVVCQTNFFCTGCPQASGFLWIIRLAGKALPINAAAECVPTVSIMVFEKAGVTGQGKSPQNREFFSETMTAWRISRQARARLSVLRCEIRAVFKPAIESP